MKDIKNYNAEKYDEKKSDYKEIEEGIFELIERGKKIYVTSLSFIQEPEFGEGGSSSDISQYPVEDILDKFYEDLVNGVGLDYICSNHGELVDKYYDGIFTWYVYEDGYKIGFDDRD